MADPMHPPPTRILIVDDDEHIISVLARLFAAEEVTTTLSARDALQRLRSGETPDVILCDLSMPEIDGVELYEVLRAERPELCARIVFLSGGAYEPRTIAFTERTQQPVLDKPFRFDDLRSAIADILDPHRKVG